MAENQIQESIQGLKTNHSIRVVILSSREQLLTLVSDIKDDSGTVLGFRLFYPYMLGLGDPGEDGNIPIRYQKWCPFTPLQEFQVKPDHIVTVALPDNNILENYVQELESLGISRDKLFYEEETDGDNSEPDQATE